LYTFDARQETSSHSSSTPTLDREPKKTQEIVIRSRSTELAQESFRHITAKVAEQRNVDVKYAIIDRSGRYIKTRAINPLATVHVI